MVSSMAFISVSGSCLSAAVDIIDTVKAPVTSASIIGFGVLKMMFASFIGALIIWASVALGGLIGLSSTPRRRRRF